VEEPAVRGEGRQTATFRIFGRAHPERRGWWFDTIVVEHGFSDGTRVKLQGEMALGSFHAMMVVGADSELPDIDPMDAKVALETFVRTRLDTLGLLDGSAVDCEVVQLELPTGEVVVLDTGFDGLRVEDGDRDFAQLTLVAELVAGVRLGLADFRQGIRAPVDTALFAYRGLDGIRADIGAREALTSDSRSWSRMREITGLDRTSDIEPVKDLADVRRHGGDQSITSEQRRHALTVLQRALLRYAEWCAQELPGVREALRRNAEHAEEA
jgi:hypothetical protein